MDKNSDVWSTVLILIMVFIVLIIEIVRAFSNPMGCGEMENVKSKYESGEYTEIPGKAILIKDKLYWVSSSGVIYQAHK